MGGQPGSGVRSNSSSAQARFRDPSGHRPWDPPNNAAGKADSPSHLTDEEADVMPSPHGTGRASQADWARVRAQHCPTQPLSQQVWDTQQRDLGSRARSPP